MPILDNFVLDRIPDATRRAAFHDAQQLLLHRARLLMQHERTLLELAMIHGVSRRGIARILNLPRGVVARRLRRVLRRLTNPLVIALLSERCPLEQELRQLGIEYFLQGQSMRQLADRHRLSAHQVRRMLQNIRMWHRWSRAGS